jgi:phosphate transport system substrate-binding protein
MRLSAQPDQYPENSRGCPNFSLNFSPPALLYASSLDIMTKMKFILALTLAVTSLFLAGCSTNRSPESTDSQAKQTIVNAGSDTMVNLALAWAEQYQQVNPNVSISVSGGGSGTGIASLINGTTDIANASRKMKQEEYDQAVSNGVEPIEFVVARDAIAVIVNPQNPIDQLSLQQISDIYSGKYTNWSQLGGEDRPIVRVSRETNSGTHVYFLEEVLRLGDPDNKTLFAQDTLLLPSSQGITSEVRDNPNAIGYDGLGYVTPEVKVVGVSESQQGPFIMPSAETVNLGVYPIARDLYIYSAGKPDANTQAYLDWIMSSEGQAIVKDNGFVPIIAK